MARPFEVIIIDTSSSDVPIKCEDKVPHTSESCTFKKICAQFFSSCAQLELLRQIKTKKWLNIFNKIYKKYSDIFIKCN